MRPLLAPVVLVAALAGCSGPDETASRAVVERFHTALNAADWVAMDSLLSQSARDLRPGGGTAHAFRAITARHGLYRGGALASISHDAGRTTINWSARYDRGAVPELFVLVKEGGGVKIDSYTDRAPA